MSICKIVVNLRYMFHIFWIIMEQKLDLPMDYLCQQIWNLSCTPFLEEKCEVASFHRLSLCLSLVFQPSLSQVVLLHHMYPIALWNYCPVFEPEIEKWFRLICWESKWCRNLPQIRILSIKRLADMVQKINQIN